MIVVNGIEFRTLDDEIEADGNKVYEAWCNDALVYPEPSQEPIPDEPEAEYVERIPYELYELVTFEETFHVSNSVATNWEIEFDCNQMGCAAVNSATRDNPVGDENASFNYGENCPIAVVKVEPCRYYDNELNAMAYMSKWTVYDNGRDNPGISLVRFYALDGSIVMYKGSKVPIPCPYNFVSSKFDTGEGWTSLMTGRLYRDSSYTTYRWNVPEDAPYDAATSFGVKEYYRSFHYRWEDIGANDAWYQRWIADNGMLWDAGPAEIPEREIEL